MRLRAVVAHDLTDLLGGQQPDEPGREQEGQQERSHGGCDHAGGRVAHHVEPRQPADRVLEPEQEVEEHGGYSSSSLRASSTSSMCMPREPLTSSQSPGPVHSTARTAAGIFSVVMNTRSSGIPASVAPPTISRPSFPTPTRPSTPRAATYLPSSRCRRTSSGPSSSMSPRMATARFSPRSSTSVSSAARTEDGLALYRSASTLRPPRGTISER